MFDDSSSQLPHAAFLSKGVFMMQPTEDRLSLDLTSLGRSMPIRRSRPGQGLILN